MLNVKKIEAAINQISAEKKIPREELIHIIEMAIKTAFKKKFWRPKEEDISVKIDLKDGSISITSRKTVVKEVKNPATEISFEELGEEAFDFEEGDIIEIDETDSMNMDSLENFFGRIASQVARQVIIQKISEAEKKQVYDVLKDKIWTIVSMKVLMMENGRVILDYNGNHIVLPKSEQVSRDKYIPETRLYVYVDQVVHPKDPSDVKIVVSRKHKMLIDGLLRLYIPEIQTGMVTIENIARIPWLKTKVLVWSPHKEIDPAGAIIGKKGMRITSIREELFGEKIDVISYTDDVGFMIAKSLVPGKVQKIEIDEEKKQAIVHILEEERSKVIGKDGSNILLASELLGYSLSLQVVKE